MIRLKSLLTEVKITGNDVSNDQSFVSYLKKVEGFKDKAYDDQDPTKVINPGDVVKGVLTIGYGHTGPDVKPGDTITEPAATSKLKQDIIEHFDRAYAYVSGKFPNEIANLDLEQWKMLTDFAFNPGLNKFPKFAEAVVFKNWPSAIKNYKRFFNGSELTQRNSQFYSLFLVDKDTSYKELGKGKDAPANLVGTTGKTLTSVDYCSKLAGAPQFTAQIARIMRFAEYYVEANKKKNGVTLPLNTYIKKYYPELTNIGITPQNWDKPAFCSRG